MLGAIDRHLREPVREALSDTRVVELVGPRQAGKSTLARSLVAELPAVTYVSLEAVVAKRPDVLGAPRYFSVLHKVKS